MNACLIPDQPGQFEVALHTGVAVGVADDVLAVDEVEVGAAVDARQRHALEILDRSYEQAEANVGSPGGQAGLVGLKVPVISEALIESIMLVARASGLEVGAGAYDAQKTSAAAEDLMNALKQLSWMHWLHPAWTTVKMHSANATDRNFDCIFAVRGVIGVQP